MGLQKCVIDCHKTILPARDVVLVHVKPFNKYIDQESSQVVYVATIGRYHASVDDTSVGDHHIALLSNKGQEIDGVSRQEVLIENYSWPVKAYNIYMDATRIGLNEEMLSLYDVLFDIAIVLQKIIANLVP